MDSEELSLIWSNRCDVLMSVFEDLFRSGTLIDCTLAAEGQCLRAHKVVLSASSPYFQMLFSELGEKHPVVFLRDVKYQELKAIVDFVYCGEVKVKESQLGDFLELANSLQIKGLNGIFRNIISQETITPDLRSTKRKRKKSLPVFREDHHESIKSSVNNQDVNYFDDSGPGYSLDDASTIKHEFESEILHRQTDEQINDYSMMDQCDSKSINIIGTTTNLLKNKNCNSGENAYYKYAKKLKLQLSHKSHEYNEQYFQEFWKKSILSQISTPIMPYHL